MITSLAIATSISQEDHDFLSRHYHIDDNADWLLSLDDKVMTLVNRENQLHWGIDLTQGKYRHRQQTHHSKEPLLKAIKISGKLPQRVFDMTAGALKDAFLMHSRDIAVTCVERNPILYTLQKHAIAQANVDIDLQFANAVDVSPQNEPELIYIDPMYPPNKKTAAVKKDMQVLHAIVGLDNDADTLLTSALTHNKRTVVKRPVGAPYLAEQKPNFSSQLGSTRYDVYLPITP